MIRTTLRTSAFALIGLFVSLPVCAQPALVEPDAPKEPGASTDPATPEPAVEPTPVQVPTEQPTAEAEVGVSVASEGTDAKADADAAAEATEAAPVEPPEATSVAPHTAQLMTPFANTSARARGSWFERTPLEVTMGEGDRQVGLTLYGFLQADFIYDTTRSYSDAIGHDLVARTDVYDGSVPRAQFSPRNTRIGLLFRGPTVGGMAPHAVLEADFFGNQPGTPHELSESAYYDSASMRLRHAYVKLSGASVSLLAGQAYDVFGWQNTFFPATAEFLGLPNAVFSRHTQLRISTSLDLGSVSLDLAASATRPAQRDSGIPDANAGLLLSLDDWTGISTPGNGDTRVLPLSIGVSGVGRLFKVDAFTPPPTQESNGIMGWGLSADALVPVIPAADAGDRGNALTLTGSFVMGSGVGDLMGATGGAEFPTLPNPAQANPPPEYHGNVDAGLVTFDTQGLLHTIDWQTIGAGLQYYLPPEGRVIIAANYTQGHSANLDKLYPQGGAEIQLLTHVADRSRYVDLNVFWDATPALRLGLAGAFTTVRYLDGDEPSNVRGKLQAVYFF